MSWASSRPSINYIYIYIYSYVKPAVCNIILCLVWAEWDWGTGCFGVKYTWFGLSYSDVVGSMKSTASSLIINYSLSLLELSCEDGFIYLNLANKLCIIVSNGLQAGIDLWK